MVQVQVIRVSFEAYISDHLSAEVCSPTIKQAFSRHFAYEVMVPAVWGENSGT